MTRARATTHKRRRHREVWATLAVIALAAVSGLAAAHFGTHRAWENLPATTPTSTSVPNAYPQGTP
jgi:hypothetical protein